jgi:hypothetical protein
LIYGFEHLLGACAHGNVVSEVHPSDNAVGIEEKFSRSCNIRSFWSCPGMQHIVSANDLRVGIGKQRKCVPKLLRVPLVDIRWIDADRDDTNAARVEFRKPMLETPQLGVTQWSPETAIKNQCNGLRRSRRSAEQIAEADRFSILIKQEKIGCFLPNMRCAS